MQNLQHASNSNILHRYLDDSHEHIPIELQRNQNNRRYNGSRTELDGRLDAVDDVEHEAATEEEEAPFLDYYFFTNQLLCIFMYFRMTYIYIL
jgi:hypothetical protein